MVGIAITAGMWIAFALGIYLGISAGKTIAYKEVNKKLDESIKAISDRKRERSG